MDLSQVTDQMFIAGLHAALNERGPNWVYPVEHPDWTSDGMDCSYVRPYVAEASCIIGLALHKCGVPLDQLRAVEGKNAGDVLRRSGTSVLVANAAQEAQQLQDKEYPWGAAVEAFHQHLTVNNYQPKENV